MKIVNVVYWAGIEYLYTKDHLEYSKLEGGFVYAFFRTKDVKTFLQKIESFFIDQKLEIIRVEFVNIYDKNTLWEKAEDKIKFRILVKKAELENTVVLDDFYAFKRK